jgi:hypothetical protein
MHDGPVPPEDDLPLIRDVPRRPDPGVAGSRKLVQIAQSAAFVWIVFWWLFAPSEGPARWYVGAAGALLVIGIRVWLHLKGSELVDVSHLRFELLEPSVRRGRRAQVRLTILDPARVRGTLAIGVACHETYDYTSDTDNHGPRRRQRSHILWEARLADNPASGDPVAFEVPPHLPFTWEGTIVKYRWTLTATEKVERRLDPTIELPLQVLP